MSEPEAPPGQTPDPGSTAAPLEPAVPAPPSGDDVNLLYQDRHGVPPPGPRLVLDTPERRAARESAAQEAEFDYQDRHGVPPPGPPPGPRLVLDTPERRAERMWQEFVATARAESAKSQADYHLMVGPNEAGNVPIMVTFQGHTLHKSVPFVGHPEILKPRAAKQALNLLRLHLLRNA